MIKAILFVTLTAGFSFSALAKETKPKASKAPTAAKDRKVAQSNAPCATEAYAAAFKYVIDDRAGEFGDFLQYFVGGAGADLVKRKGDEVTVSVRLSTWTGGVETGLGQPRQFEVVLKETHDNACQFLKIE